MESCNTIHANWIHITWRGWTVAFRSLNLILPVPVVILFGLQHSKTNTTIRSKIGAGMDTPGISEDYYSNMFFSSGWSKEASSQKLK